VTALDLDYRAGRPQQILFINEDCIDSRTFRSLLALNLCLPTLSAHHIYTPIASTSNIDRIATRIFTRPLCLLTLDSYHLKGPCSPLYTTALDLQQASDGWKGGKASHRIDRASVYGLYIIGHGRYSITSLSSPRYQYWAFWDELQILWMKTARMRKQARLLRMRKQARLIRTFRCSTKRTFRCSTDKAAIERPPSPFRGLDW